MNTVKEFNISISLGFVLYSFVAVSAWVFSDEILKRKAQEFKIGGFWKVDQTRPVTNAGALGVLCQRHFSCRPRVAPVPVMGSGCVIVHVHGAGLARSVHCTGCGRWRAALLVCTHPRCPSLRVFEEDRAWRMSSSPGMSWLSAGRPAGGYGASSPPCWHGARGRGVWGRLPQGGHLGLALRVASCCRCVLVWPP